MIFSPPNELEFLERGFGFSAAHDPDEAVISYMRKYNDGKELTITYSIGATSSVCVSLSTKSQILSRLELDGVNGASFQTWDGEAVIRMYFSDAKVDADLRVHYGGSPSIHYASLA